MQELLESIAEIISDYRAGEIATPDAAHVKKWIGQFDAASREQILKETAYVLNKTYLTRVRCVKFLNSVATTDKLTGDDPAKFWENVRFLRIQKGGQSQSDMLALFEVTLNKKFGFNKLPEGKSSTFIYLDDISFSGNRILNDFREWIAGSAPKKAEVNIIVMAFHTGGQYYAKTELLKAARTAEKEIKFNWWRSAEIEDQKQNTDSSDVLRPVHVPNDARVKAYVANMKYPPVLRSAGNIGKHSYFSTDEARQLIEQEFLKAGCRIREICPNLPIRHRPLGFSLLDTLGFGTMFATYRNCPNNAPLALWAGAPWFPLLPRKNN